MTQSTQKSPTWLVVIVWFFVCLPLGWGLYQSIMKSKPLFIAPVVQTVPAKTIK